MDWRAKVELFEQLRREHEFGIGTIAGVAVKFGVHRRLVRQAIGNALPLAQISPACEPYQRGCLEPYRPYQAPEPIPAALAETSQPGLRRIGPGVAVVCE